MQNLRYKSDNTVVHNGFAGISSCSLIRKKASFSTYYSHKSSRHLLSGIFSTLPFITQSFTQMFYDPLMYLLLLAHFINDSFDNPIILRLFTNFITSSVCLIFLGLHGNLWVNQREIHQNPSSVKRQSGITAPVGRFYSVCRLTAART